MATLSKFSFPSGDYYFEQPWTLDGKTFLLTMRFNSRMQLWFMDISDSVGSAIVCGIALKSSRNLLSAYRYMALPAGALFVYDATGKDSDPGPDSFSTTHSLFYGVSP